MPVRQVQVMVEPMRATTEQERIGADDTGSDKGGMPGSAGGGMPESAGGGVSVNPVPLIAAGLVLGALALDAGLGDGWRRAALVGVGGLLGITLYHASFGFTAAWRVFVFERRGAGLRAQLVMLAIAVSLFFPLLAAGEAFGQRLGGFVAPVGVSVAVGAFLFGIGMQLGGGCASGTLYTAGGGNTRMIVTLAAFIAGSFIGSLHLPWWLDLPNVGAVSLLATLGWLPALAANLGVFAALWWLVGHLSRGESAAGESAGPAGWRRVVRGPWPLLWGAVGLTLLNAATLLLAGHPWGITSGFALWGGQIAQALGAELGAFPYWAARQGALAASPLADTVSLMNVAIIAGAMVAASLAGRFRPEWRLPWRALATAVLGGLLMGYGARLAFGCNIGAFFSGVASGSLHGWLWLACGFTGSILGTRLRRLMRDGPYARGLPQPA
ncbi:MAG: YeeE/YedE family protein [Azospirillaceae bacterium]